MIIQLDGRRHLQVDKAVHNWENRYRVGGAASGNVTLHTQSPLRTLGAGTAVLPLFAAPRIAGQVSKKQVEQTETPVAQQIDSAKQTTKDLIAQKAEMLRSKGSDIDTQVANVATDDAGSVRPVIPVAALALITLTVWKRRH
jgi:hypothetical protein